MMFYLFVCGVVVGIGRVLVGLVMVDIGYFLVIVVIFIIGIFIVKYVVFIVNDSKFENDKVRY